MLHQSATWSLRQVKLRPGSKGARRAHSPWVEASHRALPWSHRSGGGFTEPGDGKMEKEKGFKIGPRVCALPLWQDETEVLGTAGR